MIVHILRIFSVITTEDRYDDSGLKFKVTPVSASNSKSQHSIEGEFIKPQRGLLAPHPLSIQEQKHPSGPTTAFLQALGSWSFLF